MLNKIYGAIQKYDMLKRGDHVIVAVSGGADSVCLLHVLLSLKEEYGLVITAAHLNHNLRGNESIRDERFVKELCQKLGVGLAVKSADILGVSKKRGMSLEEAGRLERYRFFDGLAEKSKAKIAVAHNLNDSAETALLNFARGTALRGLCGIPPKRGDIIRPLIFCERAEIEKYVSENGLSFMTDSTNESDAFTRNRIRNQMLPEFLSVNPGFFKTLGPNLESLRSDADFLDKLAKKELDAILTPDDSIDREKYLKNNISLRFRMLRLLISLGASIDNKRLTRLDNMVIAGSGVEQLSRSFIFAVDEKTFYLTKPKPKPERLDTRVNIPLELPACGKEARIAVSGGRELRLLNTDCEYYEENIKYDKNLLKNAVDCDKINGTALARQKIPGDFIRLNGRGCAKTLKKLFLEAKIPIEERGEILVVSDMSGPFWVEGFGVSERASISQETSRVLVISVK